MAIARVVLFLVVIGFGCTAPTTTKSPFEVQESSQGIALTENDRPVFFYQRQPKASTENKVYTNYLHPLYDLKGDTITEEFPDDHPYHRGIFWAWHQLYIHDQSVGDGWIMEDIAQDVVAVNATLDKEEARLHTQVLWKSENFENGNPFIEEHTSITVHQRHGELRSIDFEISLKALVPGVQLGGSEDIKGYGGFCARIKLPKNMTFTSAEGLVTPQEGQVVAGAWMDFTYYDSASQVESGLAILCHPTTPNYPAPWILRQSGSMQNIVYPGAERIELSMDKPNILRYRLIIHNGNTEKAAIAAHQSEYEKLILHP